MRFFITLTLSFVYTFLLVSSIVLLTLPTFLNARTIQSSLSQIGFFEYTTPILQNRLVPSLSTGNTEFDTVIQTNINQIITTEWVSETTQNLIEKIIEPTISNKQLTDFPIDFSKVKANYLGLLKSSSSKFNLKNLENSVPSSIQFTELLQLTKDDLYNFSSEIKRIAKTIGYSKYICLGLVIITTAVIFFIYSKIISVRIILSNIVTTGILFLALPFVFHFVILTPQYLTKITKTVAWWQSIGIFFDLSLIEKALSVWQTIGLAISLISLILLTLTYIFNKSK